MQRNQTSLIAFAIVALVVPVSLTAAAQTPSIPQPSISPQSAPGTRDPSPPAVNREDAPVHVDDRQFLKNAAVGGMTEVELGKLAVQKASSDSVKQFGQRMVDDHTKANDRLKEVANKENVNIPDKLDSKHQARVDKLSKLSGPAFDKAYAKDQLKDHEQDVDDFKSEATKGTDPGVKQFASATLPTLQEHLELAKSLNKTQKTEAK